MNCEEFRERVLDYVEGNLEKLELGAFRHHFTSCAACSEALRSVEGQAELLTALPRPAAPRDLGARIDQAVSDHARLKAVRPFRGLKWIVAASAAAAVLALALFRPAAPETPGTAPHVFTIVDVVLPESGPVFGKLAPSYENPGASLFDPIAVGERR